MDYKYTTTFESPLLACEINESSLISQASLDNLAPLVPTDIDYGRLVGETLANLFLQQDGHKISSSLKSKHY